MGVDLSVSQSQIYCGHRGEDVFISWIEVKKMGGDIEGKRKGEWWERGCTDEGFEEMV